MQFYEKFKQGIIEKEQYLLKRKELINRYNEISEEIYVIDSKIKESTASGHNLDVNKLREAISKKKLIKDWVDEVIDKIYVYDKDKVEIVWKCDL